jgi:hypothetical protein
MSLESHMGEVGTAGLAQELGVRARSLSDEEKRLFVTAMKEAQTYYAGIARTLRETVEQQGITLEQQTAILNQMLHNGRLSQDFRETWQYTEGVLR